MTSIGTLTGQVEAYNNAPVDDRMARVAQVMSKFASTLVLKPIGVELEKSGPAAAWSDSDTIWFNTSEVMVPTTPEDVIAVRGLALHEISHIMMTPSVGTKLGKRVMAARLWRAFNCLEDQRIETWMVSRFSNVSSWLQGTVSSFLLKEIENYSVMFPLIHGRKYLPLALRNKIQSMYEDQVNVSAISALIDEYVQLNVMDSRSYDRAFEIVEEYSRLVNLGLDRASIGHPWMRQDGWGRVPDPNGHGKGRPDEYGQKPMTGKQANPIIVKVQQAIAKDKAQGVGNGEIEQSTPQQQPSESQPQREANDLKEDVPQVKHIPPVSNGASELEGIIASVLDRVKEDMQVEIDKNLRQFSGELELNSKRLPDPPKTRSHWWGSADFAPSIEVVQSSKSFANELKKLKSDNEPGWLRKTEAGKLNVARYGTGCETDEAFDLWDLGREDAVDIECVILLDNSGSMGNRIQEAYEAMWAIKRSMDKVGASTTVVAFSDTDRTIYSAKDRAGKVVPHIGLGGGTMPFNSLRYARSVFANSTRAIKILIPITDGAWAQSEESNRVIRQLRSAGVVTALGMIDANKDNNGKYVIDAHGCEVAVAIDDIRNLFHLAKAVVRVGIDRNLNK